MATNFINISGPNTAKFIESGDYSLRVEIGSNAKELLSDHLTQFLICGTLLAVFLIWGVTAILIAANSHK